MQTEIGHEAVLVLCLKTGRQVGLGELRRLGGSLGGRRPCADRPILGRKIGRLTTSLDVLANVQRA